MSFSFNLGLFRAFFGRKNRSQKLAETRAIPLPKCQFLVKNGHFLRKFFPQKKVSKLLKMNENRLKCHFLLIWGILGHFLVEKLGVKITLK